MLLPALLFLAPQHPGAAIDNHLTAGRYLSALAEAELGEGIDKPGTLEMDQYGLVLSFLSLERETLAVFDAMGGPVSPAAALASSPLDESEALDAIPALVAAAKGRRIVIVRGPADPPAFLLVPGEYRLQLVDEDGEVRARVEKLVVR